MTSRSCILPVISFSILSPGLSEPPGIPTFPAELFRSFPAGEPLHHSLCPGRSENRLQVIFQNIAQSNDPLSVQAAGHHPAITEDSEMIPQTIAEDALALILRFAVRPGEAVGVFQIDPISHLDAPGGLPARCGEMPAGSWPRCAGSAPHRSHCSTVLAPPESPGQKHSGQNPGSR